MHSLEGYLLVASPRLESPPFSQTVLLLLHHSDQGAFGVVLNRPIGQSVKTLWSELSDRPCRSDRPLYMGGPVSGPLMALHCEKALAEMEAPGGVYVAATKEHLEQLVAEEGQRYRMFVGHAGWESGQLERELAAGLWLVAPASADQVFSEEEDLWRRVLHQVGRSILLSTLKIKHIPPDVSLN